MSDLKDALAVLELPPKTTRSEVQKAYRTLLKVWHPDRFTGDSEMQATAEERTKRITLAYGTVMDYLKSRQAATQADPSAEAKRQHGAAQRERTKHKEEKRAAPKARRGAERNFASEFERRVNEEYRASHPEAEEKRRQESAQRERTQREVEAEEKSRQESAQRERTQREAENEARRAKVRRSAMKNYASEFERRVNEEYDARRRR